MKMYEEDFVKRTIFSTIKHFGSDVKYGLYCSEILNLIVTILFVLILKFVGYYIDICFIWNTSTSEDVKLTSHLFNLQR